MVLRHSTFEQVPLSVTVCLSIDDVDLVSSYVFLSVVFHTVKFFMKYVHA